MGIFSELLSEQREQLLINARAVELVESRSSLENPQTPLSFPAEWLLDIFNGGQTDSGIRVSNLTALQVTTFFSCVDLISGSIASLPWHVYERSFLKKSGRAVHRIAYEHDLYDLFEVQPNDEMSAFTMKRALVVHMLAWGNGYIEIQRDGGNGVVALWPRNPDKTRPIRLKQAAHLGPSPWRPFPVNLPAGTLAFRTTDGIETFDNSEAGAEQNEGRIIPAEDMIHVPGLSLDGRIGQDTVWLARQLLGLWLASEKFGAKYFANFARPGGILTAPAGMKKEDRESAKRSWQEAQGGENSNRVAVLPNPGWTWTATSHNPEDAQAIQTRAFLRSEIASGLFHVPPHMVGDVDKGRANTEQLAQELISYCLSTHIAAIKQEFKRKIFPHSGIGRTPKSPYFVDFDLWALLRPDSASREKFYATMKQWGIACTNDILEYEGLNPIDEDWAEERWMPINMTLVTTPVDPTHQDGAGNGDVPADPNDSKDAGDGSDPAERSYFRMFRDSLGRVLAREKRDLKAFQNAFGPVLFSMRDQFAGDAGRVAGQATEKFVAEYISTMQHRSQKFTDNDECARTELLRAVLALRSAADRDPKKDS